MTLTPYETNAASLKQADAWHLLWRTGFGASLSNLKTIEGKPLSEAVDLIVTRQPESEVYQSTQRLLKNVAIDTGEISDLKAWWLYRIHQTANPLNERIVLMWHNHFATSFAKVKSVAHMSAQNELIREHSLSDFRAMLHGMSEDVAMLIWLDGNANRKRHPNENFAREVMELFSLGVGNYTEDDIKEAARAFTGWHVRNDEFWFNRLQHDTGTKHVLGKSGNLNGHDIVDLCLEQPSCKEFLAEKLLKTFVTHTPSEAEIVAVATSIAKHDFNVAAVMQELLSSTLFWNPDHRHSLIKSPIEFVMGTYRALDAKPNYKNAGKLLKTLGQELFEPPSVKGWEGGRQWINSTSLIQRMNFVTELTTSDKAGRLDNIASLNKQFQRDNLCSWEELLLGRPASKQVAQQLKQSLQKQEKKVIQQRLHFLLTLPDYQLC